MNNQINYAEMKEQLIATLASEIKELEANMQTSCITSTPFILVISEMYVSPVFQNKKTTGEINWSMNPLRATQFCKEDAEMLAGQIRNGKGEIAKAIGIFQAVRCRHSRATEMLNALKKISTETAALAI